MSSPINIPQAVEEISRKNSKLIPLEMEGKGFTYKEILSSSKSIASFLSHKGIRQGDRAAIFLEGRPEWGIVYLGISFLGAVAVPIDIQLSAEEVRNLVQDSGSKAIFISERSVKTLKDVGKGLKPIEVITIDTKEFFDILTYPHLISLPSVSPDDIASLIYTSGTTGRPKGVMLTHRNLLSNVQSTQKGKLIDESDCVLSVLPLHHSYPFMVTFLVPLLAGAKVIYLQSLKGPDILKTMVENGVTVLIGVPQLLAMLRRGMIDEMKKLPSPLYGIIFFLLKICGFLRDRFRINLGRIIFSTIHKRFGKRFRFFVSGGAKLDSQVSQDLEALGFTIIEGYGLTETSPIISFSPLNRIKKGSVGLPLPGVEVKIINPDKVGVGEITVRGPNVMKGYYRNPEETERVIKDSWFLTGDLGYIDKDGYIFITGRTKEVIVLSSGKNIYPEEIENHYLQSPFIKEICVFGIEKRPGITDTLQAVVVPNMDYMREQRISNFHEAVRWEIHDLSSNLPPYKRIMGYEVSQSPLPKTTLGKLKRYVIKDIVSGVAEKEEKEIQEIEIQEEEKEVLKSPTGKLVVASLEGITEKRPIRLDHNLELDLGIDSLARVELIVALSRAFSIEMPDTFLADVYSVRGLIEKIEVFHKGLGGEVAREVSKKWEEVFAIEPSSKDQKAVGLVQGSLTRLCIVFVISLLRLIAKIFFGLEVKGVENIPPPPYIITPNHASNLDGFLIGIGVPLKSFMNLYFLGFQEYFNNWFTSRFARLAHVIPVDPEMYLKRALHISGYVLKKSKALCIFPEGGRTYDGNPLPFKKGVGILSKELSVPLLPTWIEGTHEVLPRGATWPKFRKIKITFGKPIYPNEMDISERPADMDDYGWIISQLKNAIVRLKG